LVLAQVRLQLLAQELALEVFVAHLSLSPLLGRFGLLLLAVMLNFPLHNS
jgi:hypothetical protein